MVVSFLKAEYFVIIWMVTIMVSGHSNVCWKMISTNNLLWNELACVMILRIYIRLFSCFRSGTYESSENSGLEGTENIWCLLWLCGKNTKPHDDVWCEMCKKDIKCSLENTTTLQHSTEVLVIGFKLYI